MESSCNIPVYNVFIWCQQTTMLKHLHSIVCLLPRNNGYFQQSNGTTVAWQHVCVLCKASQSHLNQKCRMKKKSIFICFVMCVCSMVVCTTVCSFPSHYNCLIGETNNFLHLSKNHEFYWATAAAMRGWRSKLNIRIQSTCRRWTISVFFSSLFLSEISKGIVWPPYSCEKKKQCQHECDMPRYIALRNTTHTFPELL